MSHSAQPDSTTRETAARALVPHPSGAFLSVTASAGGGAHRAGAGIGDGCTQNGGESKWIKRNHFPVADDPHP
jgi:hypothetical protein